MLKELCPNFPCSQRLCSANWLSLLWSQSLCVDVGKPLLAVGFTWKYTFQTVLISQKSFAGSAIVAVPVKQKAQK